MICFKSFEMTCVDLRLANNAKEKIEQHPGNQGKLFLYVYEMAFIS